MGVGIRAFDAPDRDALGRVIDAVCAGSPWMSTRRFEPTPAWRHALDAPACPAHLLLVAEDAGRVVGWCRLFPADCSRAGAGLEMGLGLLPAYRGLGLGEACVRRALAWAGGHGARQVTLLAHPTNLPAISLYEKCGFSHTGPQAGGWIQMECRPGCEEEKAWLTKSR